MRPIIERQNVALLADIAALRRLISGSPIPTELQSYRDTLLQLLNHHQKTVERNLRWLRLGRANILDNIYSETLNVIYSMRLLSDCHAVPVLRAAESDRLCLALIHWMHGVHPQTQNCPAACVDGNCSILPKHGLPLYYFPCAEKRTLLYLPLFFHEIGHELYLYHKREMDELVRDLRRDIDDLLMPASQRNDSHLEQQATQRQSIIDTWYSWMQEFYCDAVGLTIGGPCYLQAFSTFISPLWQMNFYREPKYLKSSHPVTLLRIRFLTKRARATGYTEIAQQVEGQWDEVARAIGIEEDYHGFYDNVLEQVVDETLENMLVETNPRACTPSEAGGGLWVAGEDTPIRLLNWAWQQYMANRDHYSNWEIERIDDFLNNST